MKAQYYHFAIHRLNLCAVQAVNTPEIQHAQNIIIDTVSFFKYSAKRMELKKTTAEFLKHSYCRGATQDSWNVILLCYNSITS